MIFALETWDQFYEEGLVLLARHMEETKLHDEVSVNMDMGLYKALWASGQLLLLTARDKEQMVGYFIIQIAQHNRSKTTLIAQEEGLYLAPEYRKGRNGMRLVQLGIEAAKAVGAEMMFCSSLVERPIGGLLQRLGFRKNAEVFMMKFGE